jgi:hypothetical protein
MLRQQLASLDGERGSETIAELNSDIGADELALQAAISEANGLMARLLGWRHFLLSRRDSACSAMAESISQLKTDFGATRAEIEAASAEWEQRFAELAE